MKTLRSAIAIAAAIAFQFAGRAAERFLVFDLTTPPAAGDLIYYNGTNWLIVPRGASGQVLTLVGGLPLWSAVSGTGDVVGPSASTNGFLPVFSGSTGKLLRSTTLSETNIATLTELAASYQPLDADLTDLADGSLTGSKVGSGISGDNVTTGTIADARIDSALARDAEVAAGYQPMHSNLTALSSSGSTGTGAFVRASSPTIDAPTLTGITRIDTNEVGYLVVSNFVGTLPEANVDAAIARDTEVAAAYQPLDADLTALATNNGSALTNLNAGNLASGTVASARLGSGTANSSTFLRGDGTWNTPTGSGDVVGPASSTTNNLAAYNGTTGKLLKDSGIASSNVLTITAAAAAYQPLDADLTDLADGSLTGSKVGTGIDAGNITTGTLAAARVATNFPGIVATNLTAVSKLAIPQSDDPDVGAAGDLSWDTDGWLRAWDGSAQVAVGRKVVQIDVTVYKPNSLDTAQRDAMWIWSNKSGMNFIVTGWSAWSTSDNTDLTIKEVDGDGANSTTVDVVSITTDGTSLFYASDSTITAGTIENGHMLLLDFDDTDTPSQVHITITGYYNADVN